MPVNPISVGSCVSVVYAAFGASLRSVVIGHLYCPWGEPWAMECIVLSGSICFRFFKTNTVIPYL